MDKFVHNQNLHRFRKQLTEAKDETQRSMILKLIAAEEAKDAPSHDNESGSLEPMNNNSHQAS